MEVPLSASAPRATGIILFVTFVSVQHRRVLQASGLPPSAPRDSGLGQGGDGTCSFTGHAAEEVALPLRVPGRSFLLDAQGKLHAVSVDGWLRRLTQGAVGKWSRSGLWALSCHPLEQGLG